MVTLDRTPHKILGVSETIEYGKLRIVYRTKIHQHLQKKISTIIFRHICRAYETLSDFDKRGRYDKDKEWISDLSIDKYTPQQLAAEPDLIRELKRRLEKANLTEINAQDPVTGHTTLYCAARAGNVEAIKFLTERGAEPDLSQRTKSTALHAAAFYGHATVVRCLLEIGADYRVVNAADNTAEKEAVNDSVRKVFTELKQNPYVRVAANELDWFRKNRLTQHQDTEYFTQRQTLLHCASKKGYFDMMRLLVEQRSANIDLVDFNGNSALHLAAYGGHTNIVDYLLNRGCDSTFKNRWGTTAEEEGSKHGRTITDLFQHMRERDVFEMARKGVDWWFYYHFGNQSTDMTDSTGRSLLYYACGYGQNVVVKWLLEHKANINIQMQNNPKSTPLHVAKYRGHLSIVELLLEYGADVTIKNDFGATVFDESVCDGVNEDVADNIKKRLERYQHYLESHKLIDVEVYIDDDKEERPEERLRIDHKTMYADLLQLLPRDLLGENDYFSIAGRPLLFDKPNKRVMSAVYCARYGNSKLLDTPLRITLHKKPLNKKHQYNNREDPEIEVRQVAFIFNEENEKYSFLLKYPFTDKQTFNGGDLIFTFAANCVKEDVTFQVTRVRPSDNQRNSCPNAICFFKTNLSNGKGSNTLLILPSVTIADQPNARLYTMAAPSSFWFGSEKRSDQLPMIGGVHAFIEYVNIISGHLALPADMFLGQSLHRREDPVSCRYLILRQQDTRIFPHIAYHGTNIDAIRSILLDGLLIPGTVAGSGKRITPPDGHIARNRTAMCVPDFATAIFLSPSIHYSSDLTYAKPFSVDDQTWIPVLKCSVKTKGYKTYRCTTKNYQAHPGDDMNTIEWRVTDPANVQINEILFITKFDSMTTTRTTRMASIASL